MNIEELKTALGFIDDEAVLKSITLYVTSPDGLQLFNMVEDDIKELLPIYTSLLHSKIIDCEGLSIGDYSISSVRENMIYRYDLQEEHRTQEMANMAIAGTEENPSYFSVSSESLEKINGIYVVINDAEHRIVLYKQISPVDKTYGRSTYWFGLKSDNSMFERKKESMLRLTPGIQMLYADGEIILVEMTRLESALGLDAILQKEAQATYQSVEAKNIAVDISLVKEVCQQPSMLKKLRHALTESKVNDIPNEDVIRFAASQPKLNFKFNDDNTRFDLSTKAAARRFIKLLDDDYLFSNLTKEDYDSEQKGILVKAEE